MAVRGPIRGETAIDLRDNSEVLIEREDVHKRLPQNIEQMTDALLRSTLEEMLERALDLGLTDKGGAAAARKNVAQGKFTNLHYINLWAERLERRKGWPRKSTHHSKPTPLASGTVVP